MAEFFQSTYNRNERKKQRSGNVPYTCTPPRVQYTVHIPNDFPIGLRRNLWLISNGGPNIKKLGKSGLGTFLFLPVGHYSPCA